MNYRNLIGAGLTVLTLGCSNDNLLYQKTLPDVINTSMSVRGLSEDEINSRKYRFLNDIEPDKKEGRYVNANGLTYFLHESNWYIYEQGSDANELPIGGAQLSNFNGINIQVLQDLYHPEIFTDELAREKMYGRLKGIYAENYPDSFN